MDVRTDRQTDSSSRSARSLGSAWGAMGDQGCFGAARVRARGDGPAKNTWGGVKLEGGEMEVSLFTTGLFFPGSLLTAPVEYFPTARSTWPRGEVALASSPPQSRSFC